MATINFYTQGKKNPVKIYVRVREGIYIDAKAPTRYVINKEDWDSKRGKPRHLQDATFRRLNSDLENLRNTILEKFNSIEDKTSGSKWLKAIAIPPKEEAKVPIELVNYIDYYIEAKKNEVKQTSIVKFNVVKNKLKRFEEEKGETILISSVNPNFKLEFENYCSKNNYSKNTVARDLRFIKTFCRHARQMGVKTNHQLDLIRSTTEKVQKIYLTLAELEKIKETNFEFDSYLDNARDWLLVLCNTAQRVSDALNFTSNKIRIEQGFKFIDFTQKKTGKVMTIPVLPEVQRILDKRDGEFPRKISDVKLNRYIKEVCEISGINTVVKGAKINKDINRKEVGDYPKWELVTTHIGRRSFATNYYGKISSALLISMTGHSTETQFLEYIGKSRSDSALELAKIFNEK